MGRGTIVNERTECDDASACLSVTHSGDWTRPDPEKIKWRAVADIEKHANLGASIWQSVLSRRQATTFWPEETSDLSGLGFEPKAQSPEPKAQSPKPRA
jgi:hypothetical protein